MAGGARLRATRSWRRTLGFRRFLHNATDHHVKEMLRRDPQYFYKILPYAQAMGQGRHFTALFHGPA